MVRSAVMFKNRCGFEVEARPVFNTRTKIFLLDPFGHIVRRTLWKTKEGIYVVFCNRIAYRYIHGDLIDSWERWF